MPSNTIPEAGWVTSIAGVPLSAYGWTCLDPEQLRNVAEKRRANTVMPNVDGTRGNPAFRGELKLTLHMLFYGNEQDVSGIANADEILGLQANLDYFIERVLEAEEDEDGCVECIVNHRDDTVSTFPIQVDGMPIGDGDTECSANLMVTVPAGKISAGV